MTYLTGKRFKTLDGGKTGVIVSEPFSGIVGFDSDNNPIEWSTRVAVLWDDGSMEGAVDIEELKIVEEDIGYVVCTTWPDPNCETLVHETWWSKTSLKHAKIRLSQVRFKDKNPRIGKVIFPFE